MTTSPTGILVRRIISGGQTGVDRAALDAAIQLGIEHGGWCPAGRLAEDGPIAEQYKLRETESAEYPVRTERNVLEADATLILYRARPAGGTDLTYRLAERHGKPFLLVDVEGPESVAFARQWLVACEAQVLNVAGPRESTEPGIAQRAYAFLVQVLDGVGRWS